MRAAGALLRAVSPSRTISFTGSGYRVSPGLREGWIPLASIEYVPRLTGQVREAIEQAIG